MKRWLAIAMLAGVSTVAWADNEGGLYVGAGVGQFNVEVDTAGPDTFKGDDTTLKVFVGWRLSPHFALELDYIDLGNSSDTVSGINYHAEVNGFAPYAIGTLPLGPIELFGKVGYYFYNVKFGSSSQNLVDDSHEDLTYGVGIGITLFDHLHARLEYEIIDVEDTDDSNAIWLSGAWRF
jgi:OOP family OmpA-OmpF porin